MLNEGTLIVVASEVPPARTGMEFTFRNAMPDTWYDVARDVSTDSGIVVCAYIFRSWHSSAFSHTNDLPDH